MKTVFLICVSSFMRSADTPSVGEHLVGMGNVISRITPLRQDVEPTKAEAYVLGALSGGRFAGHSFIALATEVLPETINEDRRLQDRLNIAVERAMMRASLREFSGLVEEVDSERNRYLCLATRFEDSRLRALQELASSANGGVRRASVSALKRLDPDNVATWLLGADQAESSAEKLWHLQCAVECEVFVERDHFWRNAGKGFWVGAEAALEMVESGRQRKAFNLFWTSAERERPLNRWHKLNDRIVEFLLSELQKREGKKQKKNMYDLIFRYGMAAVELSGRNSQLAFQGAIVVLRAQDVLRKDRGLSDSNQAAFDDEFQSFQKLVAKIIPSEEESSDLAATVDQSLMILRKTCRNLTLPGVLSP